MAVGPIPGIIVGDPEPHPTGWGKTGQISPAIIQMPNPGFAEGKEGTKPGMLKDTG